MVQPLWLNSGTLERNPGSEETKSSFSMLPCFVAGGSLIVAKATGLSCMVENTKRSGMRVYATIVRSLQGLGALAQAALTAGGPIAVGEAFGFWYV